MMSASSRRVYRDCCGNGIELTETSHDRGTTHEFVLRRCSSSADRPAYNRRRLLRWAVKFLGLGCIGVFCCAIPTLLALLVCIVVGLILLIKTLAREPIHTLLVVESVGVHIINPKSIFSDVEEYLPWKTIDNIFINEVISEVNHFYLHFSS
uniref:Uncharacterized protein n=1 Tax=Trichogramma kaykai TaxID=54128 RepID=A0ABD2WXK5_9HYME